MRPFGPRGLLVVGVLLTALAHMRFGVGALAWLAPVPFLHYLRETSGWRSRFWFGLSLYGGYSLATLKIISAPIPAFFAPAFALPCSLLLLLAYLGWDAVRRRFPGALATLGFPLFAVLAELAQHRLTPFASWGAMAYTQLENLPLLQVASLGGIAAVGFLVYWVAAGVEAIWADGREQLGSLLVALGASGAALVFGSLRLDLARTGETATVAAVGTDATFGGWPLPDGAELSAINQRLFERTARAARAGARIVVWNEGATATRPPHEAEFQRQLSEAAQRDRIELVASYVVAGDAPGTFENKYVWVRPDGSIHHSYLKHHPVPGEPALAGTTPPRVVATEAGLATGAICYDFDFPALARQLARLGIDLAVVPSSDWRGIDPIHTQMASVRAIEGGFSLLRSTRFGLSGAFDPYGRTRAWQSSFDSEERVMVAGVPKLRIPTLYTRFGDSWLSLAFALYGAALLTRRRYFVTLATTPASTSV